MKNCDLSIEETLDSEDWEKYKTLGSRMVKDMVGNLETLREKPVWKSVPEEVKTFLNQPVPAKGTDLEKIYGEFREFIMPYVKGNIHPRFWGWVEGSGTVTGMLAELLTAGMNSNLAIGNHGAVYVEEQAINWCKEIVDYPSDSEGLLVTGGSMANLIGITVARNSRFPGDFRKTGLTGINGRMTVYCSSETHNSVQKAVEMLGMGSDSLRYVPVGRDFRIDTDILEKMIDEDIKKGEIPFCVIGNAGTVNTGAFDPLNDLGEICRKRNLWFHVDGAFGALINLVPDMRYLVEGMNCADSVAFDLHKWMHMPYDVGCILVKEREKVEDTFAMEASYLSYHERGLASGVRALKDRGPELSRGMRGLKLWMTIKEHGIDKFSRLTEQNVKQAKYLGELVSSCGELELSTPVTSNITCFRYLAGSRDQEFNNRLNKEILMTLHEEGIAVPTYTILDGCYVIRVAITNHRSRKEDFEELVKEVKRIGKDLLIKLS